MRTRYRAAVRRRPTKVCRYCGKPSHNPICAKCAAKLMLGLGNEKGRAKEVE